MTPFFAHEHNIRIKNSKKVNVTICRLVSVLECHVVIDRNQYIVRNRNRNQNIHVTIPRPKHNRNSGLIVAERDQNQNRDPNYLNSKLNCHCFSFVDKKKINFLSQFL